MGWPAVGAIPLSLPCPAAIEKVYLDESLIVLNKPAGLLAVPGRGADKQDCLSARVQQRHPGALIVHRLDMATSGLMLMARSPVMQRAVAGLFERREIRKCYVAVVHGDIERSSRDLPGAEGWRTIDLPIAVDWPRRPLRVIDHIGGKPSQTPWRAVHFDIASNSTRIELQPITGRSHQLRVHLQALGHPILGDPWYGSENVPARQLLLHAFALHLKHPLTGAPMSFERAPDF
jgi:tRNA pseudouridine32 synthase / 23S rRNA pseudouridine746 synthase